MKRLMEMNRINHCTREYISFDSPQKGANIPLGLQYMLDFFSTRGPQVINDEFIQQCENKLNRPATKQLLVNHYSNSSYPGNNSPNDAPALKQGYNSEMVNMGYPVRLRKVAVANGSGNSAGQGYNQDDQVFDWNVTSLCLASPLARSEIFSLGNGNIIFNGRIINSLGALACLSSSPANLLCIPCLSIFSKSNTVFASSNSSPFDNCPGGIRPSFLDAAKSINEIFPKWLPKFVDAKALYSNHAFIPSVSALDINTTNLFFDISQIPTIGTNANYPFEAYFAPLSNQQHVFVDPTAGGIQPFGYNLIPGGNAEWAFQEVLKSHDYLQSPLNSASQNNGVFNYGRRESRFLNTVLVGSGGRLYVNSNRPSDYGSATIPQPPGGTPAPSVGSTITLETCYCDNVIVEIQSNGQFILGDNSIGSKGIVIFHSGSFLLLRSGSTLIVNEGSKIIIEPGATILIEPGVIIQLTGPNALIDVQSNTSVTIPLGQQLLITQTSVTSKGGTIQFAGGTFSLGGTLINEECNIKIGTGMNFNFNPGASLQLKGHDAVLDFAGNLNLAPNSFFTFTYPGSNSGYIRFSQPGFPSRNITGGTNSTFYFNGQGITDKVLEIAQETMYVPDVTSQFIILNGSVSMAPDARLAPLGLKQLQHTNKKPQHIK